MRAASECPDENEIVQFLEGSMPLAQRERIEHHVDVCAACADVLFGAAATAGMRRNDGRGRDRLRCGRYLLGRRVGAGGMGVVHEAHDPALDRRIAVKLIRPRATAEAATWRRACNSSSIPRDARTFASVEESRRLRREAHVLAKLAHPHIVEVFDVGIGDDGLWIAMEFLEGQSLRAWSEGSPRPLPEIVAAYLDAAEALAAAHDLGLAHGDFKPDNVMITGTGVVKVVDFGLATAAVASELDATRDPDDDAGSLLGMIAGTPAYLAPECWRGGARDARADQFAFFASLHEAVCGHRPFAGVDLRQLARNIAVGPNDRWLEAAHCPEPLTRVILRGLSPRPADRFSSMHDAARELRSAIMARKRSWPSWTAAGLGLAVALAWWTDRTPMPCAADEGIAAVWNAPRRAELASAFASVEPSVATGLVLGGIDRHVERWTEMHGRMCAAAKETDDPRLECLRANLIELRTLVDLFAAGEPTVLARASEAVLALSPPRDCEATGARVRPLDGEQRAVWTELGETLARAQALGHVGMFEEAKQLELDVAARAQDRGWSALSAHALASAGRDQTHLGEMDDGIELMQNAFFRASAVGADDVAAAAANELAIAIGYWQLRPSQGESWLRQAAIHLERLGIDPSADHGHQIAAGLVAERAGDLPRALAHQQRALESAQTPIQAAIAHANLGNLLDARKRSDDALEHYEAAVDLRRANLGDGHLETLEARANLAAFLLGQDHAADAEAILGELVARFDDPIAPSAAVRATVLENRGLAQRRLGRLDEASASLRESLQTCGAALGSEHPWCASAWVNLAVLAEDRGRLDEALGHVRTARQLLQRAGVEADAMLAQIDTHEAALLRSIADARP